MPSGRKNRGSRHRSHKQHQKQKLEESVDYDIEPNLRHGPLPDSDSSPWTMEPLPPHVEGPSVLKQDAENADSMPRGGTRKSHPEAQKGFQNLIGVQFSSKRKKEAIAAFVDADVAATTPSSLDRWDGGDSRADETLSLFEPVRDESQLHEYKKSGFDNLDVQGNGFSSKEFKGDGDGKNRKGKARTAIASTNKAITVMDTLGAGQVDTTLGDTTIRIKNKVSRRRDHSELLENDTDKSTPEVDSSLIELKGQNLASDAFDIVKTNSRKGVSGKRLEKDVSHKEFDVEAHLSHSHEIDTSISESDRKRGKMNDPGAHMSPKSWRIEDGSKSRRSEGSLKPKKSEDAAKLVSKDDAEALEEHKNTLGDVRKGNSGTDWVLQDEHRNLELEKELENRIRRRREESGDRDRWRDDDKEREVRRHHYPKDEIKHRDEKYKDEKQRQEKPKEDGGKTEKDRSDSRHRDENHKESRHAEDKQKEEKQKTDKEREERRKDDKERDEKRKGDRDREEKSIEGKHRDDRHKEDRHKDEKEKDDRQKEDKDSRRKEDRSRDNKYKSDKNKEDRFKDAKDREEKFKEEKYKDESIKSEDCSDRHKEDKDWGDRFQDEKDKRGRQRDKDDKTRDDKDRLDKHREESDRDGLRDDKGKYDKRKSEKEQDEGIRIDKPSNDRPKIEKEQDGKEKDDDCKEERERDNRQREDRFKDEKLQEADINRDYSSSHDEPFSQGKDVAEQARPKGTREQETRERRSSGKHAVHEVDRRVVKAPRDDTQDQERAFTDTLKPEHRLKRTRDLGMVDSVLAERDYASGFRPRGRQGEVENDFQRDDKVLRRIREERVSAYDALPRSPSPLADGSHLSFYGKSVRRNKFDTSVSVSSSSGTRRPRDRNRHITEHQDRGKQPYGLDEEVKSWEPRISNQDSDDGRGRSLSPERNRDSRLSLSPRASLTPVQEEFSSGPIRGSVVYEDSLVPEREHRRFSQGGGPSKARRLDDLSQERSEWLHQGAQMSRTPMGGPMVRPQLAALPNRLSGPSGLLPPPPPFRPGIDNPTILGAPNNAFEEGSGPRESGRYERKSGVPFKRSEMAGPGDAWRGIGMGNWNVQNQGPGPGNIFSPFPQIGAHPSGGFLGMGQQFPVPPLFGPGGVRPSADMNFGSARFHMGDGGVGFPGHGPNHAPVMGWHRPTEPDESCCPPFPGHLDTWERQGMYVDERQRFGRPEWDQGAQGMTGRGWERGPDLWQGQAGDTGAGFNLPRFQRDVSYEGSLGEEIPTLRQDLHLKEQKVQSLDNHLREMPGAKEPNETYPASSTDDVMTAVPISELKASNRANGRMRRLLQNVKVSAKLASSDLYKQYLSLLPPSQAKTGEVSVPNDRDISFGSVEEDFEFELDADAQELLSTPDPYSKLLPSLPESIYKAALEIYHRPDRESLVQKSIFGSFLLPIGSSLVKMPSLEVDLVNVRADGENIREQTCSSTSLMVVDETPVTVDGSNAICVSCERVEAEETELVLEDLGVVSLETMQYSDGQADEVGLVSNQEGSLAGNSVSIKLGGEIVSPDMAAGHQRAPLSVGCSMHSKSPLSEANSSINALSEAAVHYSNRDRLPLEACNLHSFAGRASPEVSTTVALHATSLEIDVNIHLHETVSGPHAGQIHGSVRPLDQNSENDPAEVLGASQQLEGEDLGRQLPADDGVGSTSVAFLTDDGTQGLGRNLEATEDYVIDEMEGKSRPPQSPEKACENTH